MAGEVKLTELVTSGGCAAKYPAARLEILERRRAALTDRLQRARRSSPGRGDRYSRSLFEHRTESTERDLEWVEALIAAEGLDDVTAGSEAAPVLPNEQGATTS